MSRLLTLLMSLSVSTVFLLTGCGNTPRPKAVAKVQLGDVQYKQGKLDDAIISYSKATNIDPSYVEAYIKLGDVLSDKNRPDDAIKAYQEVIQTDPSYIEAYIKLGDVLDKQNKLGEARVAYETAIDKDSSSYEAYIKLGNVLYKEQNFDEAIGIYDKATKTHAEPFKIAKAYISKGDVLSDLGKFDDAIIAYNNAIEKDDTNPYAYINRGVALYNQNKFKEAIVDFYKTLLYPDDASGTPSPHTIAYYSLGIALQEQGDFNGAIKYFKDAIQSDPKYDIAQNALKKAQRELMKKRLAVLDRKPTPNLEIEPTSSSNQQALDLPMRSVVKVIAKIPTGHRTGTGWVVKREGNRAWILTNHHVLKEEGAQQTREKIEVEFYNEPKRRPTQTIQINNNVNDLDLALLEVTDLPNDIQPLQISSADVLSGIAIRVIGHSSIAGTDWLLDSGMINKSTSKALVLSKLTLSKGSSGSPVLDEDNRVVGIVYSARSPSEPGETAGLGFAYPASLIREQLISWGIEIN